MGFLWKREGSCYRSSGANSRGEVSTRNLSFEWSRPVRVNNRQRFPDKIANAKDIFLREAFPVFARVNVNAFPSMWTTLRILIHDVYPPCKRVRRNRCPSVFWAGEGMQDQTKNKSHSAGQLKSNTASLSGQSTFLPNAALQRQEQEELQSRLTAHKIYTRQCKTGFRRRCRFPRKSYFLVLQKVVVSSSCWIYCCLSKASLARWKQCFENLDKVHLWYAGVSAQRCALILAKSRPVIFTGMSCLSVFCVHKQAVSSFLQAQCWILI